MKSVIDVVAVKQFQFQFRSRSASRKSLCARVPEVSKLSEIIITA